MGGSVDFVDYYEILELSPNANSETIERVFRYLARKYHPDNQDTGDRAHFDSILEAHNVLRDRVKRAQYDADYRNQSSARARLLEEAGDVDGVDRDVEIQCKLLSLFYVKRRKNIREPGIGDGELAFLVDCPADHLDFHLWYLKEKRWIARREDGQYAITIDGVDRASAHSRRGAATKLLTDQVN